MKTFNYTIKDPMGIHARPAGLLVKAVKGMGCEITIGKEGKSVAADRLLSVMGLGIRSGDTVTITVAGDGEDAAAKALKAFFEQNL